MAWVDWNLDHRRQEFLRFTQRVIRLRREQPVFRRRRFFYGKSIEGAGTPDIAWLNVDGTEMMPETWHQGWVRCLGVVLFGDSVDLDEQGDEIRGDTLLLLFNAAYDQTIGFTLPQLDEHQPWELLLDSAEPQSDRSLFQPREVYSLRDFSLALLRLCRPEDRQTV